MRPSKCGLSHEKKSVWLVIVGDYTNYINYSIFWEILGVSIFLESRYEDHGMTWGYWPCSSRIFIQGAPGVLRFPKKRGGDPHGFQCSLVGGFNPSEKWWSSSVGIIIPNWIESHKNMFQTTNQLFMSHLFFYSGLPSGYLTWPWKIAHL